MHKVWGHVGDGEIWEVGTSHVSTIKDNLGTVPLGGVRHQLIFAIEQVN